VSVTVSGTSTTTGYGSGCTAASSGTLSQPQECEAANHASSRRAGFPRKPQPRLPSPQTRGQGTTPDFASNCLAVRNSRLVMRFTPTTAAPKFRATNAANARFDRFYVVRSTGFFGRVARSDTAHAVDRLPGRSVGVEHPWSPAPFGDRTERLSRNSVVTRLGQMTTLIDCLRATELSAFVRLRSRKVPDTFRSTKPLFEGDCSCSSAGSAPDPHCAWRR
jgi:hypothetical protein